MERGTDREREAVRRRWTAMERERTLATRLLGGVSLVLLGLVALAMAAISEVCLAGAGITGTECTAVGPSLVATGLALGGAVALGVGISRCWQVARR